MKIIKSAVLLMVVILSLGSRVALAQENRLITAPGISLPRFEVGEDKTITEPIDGDLVAAGGQIKIMTDITGDAYVVGGQVEFNGSVDQDLIVAGGNVTIKGRVGKNLIVVGGQVKVDETAMVGGYVLVAGGQVSLNGQFEGSVKSGARKLEVGEMAFIGGDLEADVEQGIVSESAQIIGEKRVKIHKVETPRSSESTKDAMRGLAVIGKIVYFLSKLVTLLVLVTIAGKLMAPAVVLFSKFWTTLGWGSVVAIVTPFAIMILMMSVVGIPLSFIMIGVYMLAMYLSSLVVAMTIGNIISKKGWLPVKNNYLLSVVGLIVVSVVTSIPVVGWLMSVIVCFLGLGIIFRLTTERSKIVAKK